MIILNASLLCCFFAKMQSSQEFHGIFQFLDIDDSITRVKPEIPLCTDYMPKQGSEMPELLSYYRKTIRAEISLDANDEEQADILKRLLFRNRDIKFLDFESKDLVLNLNCLHHFGNEQQAKEIAQEHGISLESILYPKLK